MYMVKLEQFSYSNIDKRTRHFYGTMEWENTKAILPSAKIGKNVFKIC